jgi:hypothetical protein
VVGNPYRVNSLSGLAVSVTAAEILDGLEVRIVDRSEARWKRRRGMKS